MKKLIIMLFGMFLIIALMNLVSSSSSCCELTNDGKYCANDLTQSQCNTPLIEGVTCQQSSLCQGGCCYDESVGIFTTNVLERACNSPYVWDEDPNCNILQAKKGCCILGENTIYETYGQCRTDSQNYALGDSDTVDWREEYSESECVFESGIQAQGACQMSGDTCKILQEGECLSARGLFFPNKLCTAEVLNTTCEPTQETRCVEGKDQVYFIDSCGNTANIYDSSRVDKAGYWDEIIPLSESCNYGDYLSSVNSEDCGNCLRTSGICSSAIGSDTSPTYGENYCRTTGCDYVDQWGETKTYQSGESWCVYEGKVGDGDDIPGSRHYRFICAQGEIKIEACADYRNEICVQGDLQAIDNKSGVTFSNTYCRKTVGKQCANFNNQEDGMDECSQTPDCEVKNFTEAGGSFDFQYCVPMYPTGFSLDENEQESVAEICGLATKTAIYSESLINLRCKCVDNCDAKSKEFGEEMNEYCRSLGDCGLEANILGELSTGSYGWTIDGKSQLFDEAYIGLLIDLMNPVEGLFISEDKRMEGYSNANYGKPSNGEVDLFHTDLKTVVAMSIALSSIGSPTLIGVYAVAMIYSQFASCDSVEIEFTCMPWQPPVGAEDCEKCNDDKIPCSEYKCQTLGAGCELINKGQTEELCTSAEDNGDAPQVSPSETHALLAEVDYIITSNGMTIKPEQGECIDAYNLIPFSIQTHEPAVCRYSDDEFGEFEDMEALGSNAYTYNHSQSYLVKDPSRGVSQGLKITGKEILYVKCQDRFGHITPVPYIIDMCVNEGDDVTPPRIRRVIPESGEFVSFEKELTNVTLVTNELPTCRWSQNRLEEYEYMPNEFACDASIERPSSTEGYVCVGTLPTANITNKYYIKCMDQPWLIGKINESKRSVMTENYNGVYVLKKPQSQIAIEQISPKGEIIVTTSETSIDLEAKTILGASIHTCEWSLTGYDNMFPFYNTGASQTHRQILQVEPGRYSAFIECFDETGDGTRGETTFQVIQETTAPKVTRTWQTGSKINIITDEEAACRYSEESCLFDWNDGDAMSGDGTEHRLNSIKGREYFVRCKDTLGNVASGCSIILSSS